MARAKKILGIPAVLLALTLVVAACADSGTTTTTTSAPTTTTSAPTTTTSAPTTTTSAPTTTTSGPTTTTVSQKEVCIAEAESGVEEGRTPITAKVPTDAIDVSTIQGSDVWAVFGVLFDEGGRLTADATEEAGDLIGFNVRVLDGMGNPEEWNNLITQAVAANADAIIIFGIDPDLIAPALAEAEAAGIPVISGGGENAGAPARSDIYVDMTADLSRDGKIMADYVLAEIGCEGSAVLINSSLFKVAVAMNEGVTGEFARLCPVDCTLTYEEINLADMAVSLPSQASTVVRANPEIEWIIPGFDVFAFFVHQGLDEAGLTNVKTVSHDGAFANLDVIRSGGPQVASMAWSPQDYRGWVLIDEVARALLGLPPDLDEALLINQLIDASNLGPDNEFTTNFPGMAGFRDAYRNIWGL